MTRALVFLLALTLSGCVEPYPDWKVKGVSFHELPSAVQKNFAAQHGRVPAVRVEESTFESRLSGYPKLYRITFVAATGNTNSIIYDKKGHTSNPQVWVEQPPPLRGAGEANHE